VRLISPFIGGGFGGKLFLRSRHSAGALGAGGAAAGEAGADPAAIINNTTHRPATIQRIRIGATPDGKITAIGMRAGRATCRRQAGNLGEQTRLLYAGANRLTALRLAELDLPEGNAMRAPWRGAGLMALEIAMDEMAEKLGMDPVEFRIVNDTRSIRRIRKRPFSQRQFIECLRTGAERFGWNARATRDTRGAREGAG
jgi:xanthine dehydrogenase YagR molybdenum-binding subunit